MEETLMAWARGRCTVHQKCRLSKQSPIIQYCNRIIFKLLHERKIKILAPNDLMKYFLLMFYSWQKSSQILTFPVLWLLQSQSDSREETEPVLVVLSYRKLPAAWCLIVSTTPITRRQQYWTCYWSIESSL